MKAKLNIGIRHLSKHYGALLIFIGTSCAFSVLAEKTTALEEITSAKQKPIKHKITKTPYVIETLVQGSQEQPKVIYIMPWQDNNKAVSIQEQSLQVLLPLLVPINPKQFKNKLANYYQKQRVNRH